ncbi:MAG: HNH endonuclease [Myxococcota bacterium]
MPIYFRTGTSFGQFVTHAAELERVLIDDELAVEGQRIARELALESTAEETWDEKTLYIIRRCHPVQPVPVSSLLKKDGQPAAGGQAVYAIVQATELQPLGTWFPEEAPPELAKMEGAVQKVLVNRYERDPAARQMCIEANGVRCAVCDMSFEERYGERGKGYIHVHHRTPLADLDGPKAFDPKVDLVPICPNCHAMIHRGSTTLSIEELKDLLTS